MRNKLVLTSIFVLLTGVFLHAQTTQKEIQTQFIMAEEGATITLPAGTFTIDGTLSMDEKKNITIKGAGMDKTILDFKKQSEGAEGIRVTNSQNIVMEDFTVQNAKGDAIKTMEVDGITFRRVKTEWTGKPKKTNGAYGLYPVTCNNVLIEYCEAIGASDAGIYVGQSRHIIVRNCKAYKNVAGIEIENSTYADVYNCEATNNTGGILVFDLPDIPIKQGGYCRVYDNVIKENNYKNFAPKGNTVGKVPPGTGVMVLAANNVEIFNNEITNNRTFSVAIASYYITETPIKDKEYYPYPEAVHIHHNTFVREGLKPTMKNKMGILMRLKFKQGVPHIIYDGIMDPEKAGENGQLKAPYEICIHDNTGASVGNIDAENDFKNIRTDINVYDCTRDAIKEVNLNSRGE